MLFEIELLLRLFDFYFEVRENVLCIGYAF